MSSKQSSAARRRRLVLPVVLAGSVASLILALGLSPTVAAFTASIQNTVNTAATGVLSMQESNSDGTVRCNSTDGGSISTNSATCSTINKYGGSTTMVPGQTITTNISITNTGTVAAKTFSLTPGACSQAANGTVNGLATDLCTKMTLVITSGASTIYSGPLSGFTAPVDVLAKTTTTSLAAGSTLPFTFAVTLPASADNTYQGLKASQVLTWTFNS